VSQQTTNHSFDDLARAVAEGSLSRRGALKLIAGTAIAALIPSRALAGDDECVRVCHVPFNRETRECDVANARTRCVSRRERRRHLENHRCDCRGRCANCLCLPNGDTCMASDDCCSTNCTSNGFCCPSGYVALSNGTCAKRCTTGTDCPGCPAFCVTSVGGEGEDFCAASVTSDQCLADSDCPQGQFCSLGAPGDRVCVIAC
jgi:Cys-rich repeat protein